MSNNYKYSKCMDCIHAHMNKDGNNDCGFTDCVSKEDKEYEEEDVFESYMSCYDCFQKLVEFQRENEKSEWHNLNENSKDLPNEGEWVEGLYIWYYKDEPQWDIFKVRWFYEIGELDEKLICWYSSDDCWNKVDEPDYWRKITLPTRNEHDRKY